MSTNSSPSMSPIQPLHGQHAQIQVPQAPLGNSNAVLVAKTSAMGTKALLAKKLIRSKKPATSSPTDNILTPCSAKLNQTKKKHFSKAKSISKPLFAQAEPEANEETTAIEIKIPTNETSDRQDLEVQEPKGDATEDDVSELIDATAIAEDQPIYAPLEAKKANDENENPFA